MLLNALLGTLRFACKDAGEGREQDAEALPNLRYGFNPVGWAKERSDVPNNNVCAVQLVVACNFTFSCSRDSAAA